jgi:hypothetical protein
MENADRRLQPDRRLPQLRGQVERDISRIA